MAQSSSKTRPFAWEDEAIEEPRFRRAQQGVPPAGRTLPGMPLEADDLDSGDIPHTQVFRSRGPRNPWWRPAGTAGRVFLAVSALIVLGGLATSAFLLKTYLGRDGRFRIAGAGNIEASGLTEVSRAEMLPVFGEDIGRNIFFVPLSERRRQLEEIPWVERATVMRLLPDQIRVQVLERQPVAFTRQGREIGLVDANGVLLSMPAAAMARHHYSFPVVTGIDPGDPLASRKARMAVYQRLLAELDSNGQHLSEQISEIDLTDSEDARLMMPEQGADILAHFGEDHFLERYQRYKAHIAEWRQQYPKLAAVDLRYEHQVVLEMAHGLDTVEAAEGDQTAAEAAGTQPAVGHGTQGAQPGSGQTRQPKRLGSAKIKSSNSSKPLSAAAKALTAKDKAARDKKKREEAKRAALHANKPEPASYLQPAAAEGQ